MVKDAVAESLPFYALVASESRETSNALRDLISGASRAYGGRLPELGIARDATILDCACGTGAGTLGMEEAEYSVVGSDANASMLAEARRRKRELGMQAPFVRALWRDLPAKLSQRFDVVLCAENSLPHAVTKAETVASLRGMLGVLRPGGVCWASVSGPEIYGKPGEVRFPAVEPPPTRAQIGIKNLGGRETVVFEVWKVGERFITQSLFRITRGKAGWRTEVVEARIRRLWEDDLRAMMRSVGFVDIQVLRRGSNYSMGGTAP